MHGVAGRMYDRLRHHFGNDAVFMDIDSIPFGVDFREHIDAAVGQCDVLLALIGPNWAGDSEGHRQLNDRTDLVRIELESALKRNLPVIPILIDHAKMPDVAKTAAVAQALAFRNVIDVDQGRDFHPHVDRLIRGIAILFQTSSAATVRQRVPGRVDLGGRPPRPPTDPDVHVKRIWLFISCRYQREPVSCVDMV